MPQPDLRRGTIAAALCAISCLLLASCGGGSKETPGNTVEMRDMDIVDGTVNDSMTDLDAVRADGVGMPAHAGNAARPTAPRGIPEDDSPNAETVPAE